MSTNVVENLSAVPFLSRKAIFEKMLPVDLFRLSIISKKSLNMVKKCMLEASVSINFDSTSATRIEIWTPNGLYSEIVIAPHRDEDGLEFDMEIDGELFEGCFLTHFGLIVPFGIDIVLRRLFAIYSSSRTFADSLRMVLVGEVPPGLSDLLSGLGDHTSVGHFELRQGYFRGVQRDNVFGLDDFFPKLEIRKTLTLDMVPLNLPLRLLAVPELVIEDGTGLTEEFVSQVILNLPCVMVHIMESSEFTASWANVVIRDWIESDFKPSVRELQIELAPGVSGEDVMHNIEHQHTEHGEQYIEKENSVVFFTDGGLLFFF